MTLPMKIILKKAIFPCILLCFFLIFAFTKKDPSITPEEFCRKLVIQNINGIIGELDASKKLLANGKPIHKTVKQLIARYHAARKYYKEIEFFIEYYSAFDAKFYINGPLVPKIEMEISSVPIDPHGFQVLEENLFDAKKTNAAVLQNEYTLLLTKFSTLKEFYTTIHLERNKLEEALKLQLVRIMCLTLNGYDCTINKETIYETIYSLNGIALVLRSTEHKNMLPTAYLSYRTVLTSLQQCKKALQKNKDSDTFDRLGFMVRYLNPAYKDLLAYSEALKTEPSLLNYAVNFSAGSFFESNSINKQYFSVYVADTFHLTQQAALGKLLFYDPVLSGNNKRACASCHQQDKGFTDGLDKSLAFDGSSKISRNAPTVINAAYQKLFFHDGRIFNLEEQANAVFKNAFEMNSSEAEIIAKLRRSDEYSQLFKQAFKSRYDTIITTYAIIKSITEFIKTLDSRNSKFDRYLKGDKTQLSKDEISGYNLFSGKALCGSCHFFPLFNGTVPPMFNDNEFEVIGVPEWPDNRTIDPDPGREKVTRSKIHRHAFKTPTLRNIALTAPYMHNGVYKTLDSVLTFYNRGGGAGSGLKIENQTLPFDSLGLSKKELGDLKLFLLTLTDVSALPKAPTRLPAFKDADLDKRKIGGEY
jgi:cytochrome c peroxidase